MQFRSLIAPAHANVLTSFRQQSAYSLWINRVRVFAVVTLSHVLGSIRAPSKPLSDTFLETVQGASSRQLFGRKDRVLETFPRPEMENLSFPSMPS